MDRLQRREMEVGKILAGSGVDVSMWEKNAVVRKDPDFSQDKSPKPEIEEQKRDIERMASEREGSVVDKEPLEDEISGSGCWSDVDSNCVSWGSKVCRGHYATWSY